MSFQCQALQDGAQTVLVVTRMAEGAGFVLLMTDMMAWSCPCKREDDVDAHKEIVDKQGLTLKLASG